MPRELLIAAGPGEWRAAWLEGGAAVELYVERGETRPAGSTHLGRVVRRAPGLESAFVDIGDPRPGILPARQAAADGIRLDEGAAVLVEVRREAQQGKGARLSTRIRARSDGLPNRLRRDLANGEPPAQLYPAMGLAPALALRLPGSPERVTTDEPAIVPELRAVWPGAEARGDPEAWPLDIDAAIEAALSPDFDLPGGGVVRIRETPAATLIDVDSGTPRESSAESGALAVNLAAADTIARHLRLANFGGGIVIDFVGLEARSARDRVRAALSEALRADPAEPRVLGWTRLGHLEVVRPRRGRPLSDLLLDRGAGRLQRKSAVALAHEALRGIQRQARARPDANWRLAAAPAVLVALYGSAAAALRALEARLGRDIELAEAPQAQGFDIVAR